jgi:hypothetical protein
MYDGLPAYRLFSLFPGARQASCLSYMNNSSKILNSAEARTK